MSKIIILLFTLATTFSKGFHLVGNTYHANFKVPLLSKNQNLQLQFINKQTASLKLHGFINSEGNVCYNYDHEKQLFTYRPDENIAQIMKQYLVSLYDINYNETTDTPVLVITSKLFRFKQKIILTNINSN